MRTIASLGLLIVLGLSFACSDPEGACERTNGKASMCTLEKKSYCEKKNSSFNADRSFHAGQKCPELGYTRKDGTSWFRPLPGLPPP